ncbi:MAG: glycosyltransferase family 39 protein, partial [Anaerolineales bacterium]|nr:glycosyltransferase family 39 protein [Anaerolineales bacterium]
DGIHLVGRFLSGLLDMASVLFVFLIGRRLYDRRVGLLAALFHAIAVMPIQQSHFFTMDNWAAGLTTMTIYAAVRAAGFGDPERKWRVGWWVLFGVGLGTAVASRINVAPVAGIAPLAAIIWLAQRGHTWNTIKQGISSLIRGGVSSAGLDIQQAMLGVTIAALVSIAAFRIAQPYAFADPELIRTTTIAETGEEPGFFATTIGSVFGFNPQWRSNMEEIQHQQGPDFAAPFALQWTDRAPILFPLTNMVLYGMGFSAGIAAWLGFLWALWRIVRGKPDWVKHAIPIAWAGFYFVFMGTRWV